MTIDLWKSRDGYTVCLNDTHTLEFTSPEFDALINLLTENDPALGVVELPEHLGQSGCQDGFRFFLTPESNQDLLLSLRSFRREPMPEDFEGLDSLYRRITLDAEENANGQ